MMMTTAKLTASPSDVAPSFYLGTIELRISRSSSTPFARAKSQSLYVGRRDGERVLYAGKAGTGYTEKVARELREKLDPLVVKTTPPAVPVKKPKATWVRPIVDAEIEYGALTDDGLLREAVFKGLRDDVALPGVHTPARSGRGGVPRENILQLLPNAFLVPVRCYARPSPGADRQCRTAACEHAVPYRCLAMPYIQLAAPFPADKPPAGRTDSRIKHARNSA